jgi:hypothetical protein
MKIEKFTFFKGKEIHIFTYNITRGSKKYLLVKIECGTSHESVQKTKWTIYRRCDPKEDLAHFDSLAKYKRIVSYRDVLKNCKIDLRSYNWEKVPDGKWRPFGQNPKNFILNK